MLGENLMEGAWFWKAPIEAHSPIKISKNRIPGHMLIISNNGLCLCAAMQYVLLF